MKTVPHLRWVICLLLLLAMLVNYIDRQVLSILKPLIEGDLGWRETDYANIVFWFQVAYIGGMLAWGRLIDRIGTRIAFAASALIWGVGAIAQGFVSTAFGFSMARFILGLGESGNMPAGIRALTDWFPPRERGIAIGIFNAGTNVGAAIAPLLIPVAVFAFGWRGAFISTGLLAIVVLVLWWVIFQQPGDHPAISARELSCIEEGAVGEPAAPRPSLGHLLRLRGLWALCLARLCTDPVWPFLLFWLPDYFHKQYALDLRNFGPPLFAIFAIAGVGSIGGGWISSRLIRGGMRPTSARLVTLFGCALLAMSAMLVSRVSDVVFAVGLVAFLAAAHQAWSVNLYAMASDLFPRNAIGTVIAISSAMGGVGSLVMIQLVGHALANQAGYSTLFAIVGCAYLLGFLVLGLFNVRQSPSRPAA